MSICRAEPRIAVAGKTGATAADLLYYSSMQARNLLYCLAGALVALDQLTKRWAFESLSLSGRRVVISGAFDLTYTENAGIALGLLGDHGAGVRWILIAISVTAACLVAYSLASAISKIGKVPASRFLAYALTFLLAGIVGNLIDRATLGYVVDFIDLYHRQTHWPIFNIADAAITTGAIGLAIDVMWLSARSRLHRQNSAPAPGVSLNADE